jgi:stage II sporulation protein D
MPVSRRGCHGPYTLFVLARAALLVCLLSAPALAVETVRIAVGPELKVATVSAEALSAGPDEEAARFSPVPDGKAVLALKGDVLVLNDTPVPDGVVRLKATGAVLDVGAMRVQGDVVALKGKTGVQLVNVLALEDYLAGVLGSEMPRSFPMEALKAQAVAARTYALQKKLDGYEKPWHLGSSVISQVYKGLEAHDDRTREAVEATRGQVLTWRLQPIEAYFHASCGGRTESGFDALSRDLPYLKPVDCPCSALPQSKWTLSLTKAEAKKVLGGKPSEMKVQGRSRTGRAQRVELAPGRTMDAVTFREKVGYVKVKSLQFEAVPRGDGWELSGKGFGHGAGLCQWGANALADKGKGYTAILQHYYPGTELQTLY